MSETNSISPEISDSLYEDIPNFFTNPFNSNQQMSIIICNNRNYRDNCVDMLTEIIYLYLHIRIMYHAQVRSMFQFEIHLFNALQWQKLCDYFSMLFTRFQISILFYYNISFIQMLYFYLNIYSHLNRYHNLNFNLDNYLRLKLDWDYIFEFYDMLQRIYLYLITNRVFDRI